MTAFVGLLGKPVPELLNPEEREDLEIKDAPLTMYISHFVVSPLLAPETLHEEQPKPTARNSLAQGHVVKVRRKFDPLRVPGRSPDTAWVSRWTAYRNHGVLAALPASRALLPLQDKEKKKKESILDLSKYIDKTIRVKFQGGREASGILKGFDPLLNLVLDGTIEYMRDPDDQYKLTEDTRQLGLVVCRGTSVVLICPQDGMEAIPNPFIQQQEA
ncbi:PREDICTED: U6 snRNA-associated Sm-like protein LSm7 [Myotis brandtii]|nr:PREDICTED: U6 snRNA-associated Sm-like protein LSm7 [Myotis brandtii]